ncbi:MAG: hypothetical protein DRR19_02440 [Candidatus Parabeggiatoa sp. nov. 1]|nr:MAG: hypothetical protein DRR19_02440 [Gammaproteobacteria bacterium]
MRCTGYQPIREILQCAVLVINQSVKSGKKLYLPIREIRKEVVLVINKSIKSVNPFTDTIPKKG